MLLKKSPEAASQPPAAPEPAGTLFARIKKEIAVIRPQGELPAKNAGSFSRYSCDLCHAPHGIGDLRQCGLCGRWVCPSCRNDEYYICSSCNGIVKLHTLGMEKR